MKRHEQSNVRGTKLLVDTTGYGFYNEAEQLGVSGLGLQMQVDGEPASLSYRSTTADGDVVCAVGAVTDGLEVRTAFALRSDIDALTVRHTFKNIGHKPVHLDHLVTTQLADGQVRPGPHHGWDMRYCHSDNLRTERYPICQMESPYVRTLPAEAAHFGRGEDQPFPALYLTDRQYRHGIVVAAAQQSHSIQSWRLQGRPLGASGSSALQVFEMHHELPMASGYTLDAGAEWNLDGTYLQLCRGTHPEDAFVDYVDNLAASHTFRGDTTQLLESAFFCSWNYGRFSNQVADELMVTARFIAEHLPRLKYFLVDAGYTTQTVDRSGANTFDFLDMFYRGAEAALDRDKFPNGMKAFADDIRALGLRPGLWWSPTVRLDSQLAADHPDWILRNENGSPFAIGDSGYLDLTQGGAQKYLDEVLAVILGEWGMDATKMDFWSQCFERRGGCVQGLNQTAIDCRRILFETVRRHLPDDGVFMTCVATGMGNPFMAEHADTYRNTIDIGEGLWREQYNSCYWALPVLGISGRKTYLHNNDSVGIGLDFPRNENLFRLTWGFITMGMQEIGGQLETLPPDYVKALRKFTDRCDRGYRCRCPDEKAWRGEPLPEVLYVDYPDDSPTACAGIRQSLALFNWTDSPKIISVRRADLGHAAAVRAVDFWTEAEEQFDAEFITKRLDARSALLYDVMA